MFKKSRIAMLAIATAGIIGLGASAASASTSSPSWNPGGNGYGQGQAYGLGDGVGGQGYNNPGNASSQSLSDGNSGAVQVNPVLCGNAVEIPLSAAANVLGGSLGPVTSAPTTGGGAGCQQGANT